MQNLIRRTDLHDFPERKCEDSSIKSKKSQCQGAIELTFHPKTCVLFATKEQESDTFLNVHIKVC